MDEERWVRSRRRLQTEEDWRSCDQPHQIARLLEGKASDRKARLFEVACLRRMWHWPEVENRGWAVEELERHAEGFATPEEALRTSQALHEARDCATWVMGGLWNQAFDEIEEHVAGALAIAGKTCEAMNIAAGRLARASAGLDERHRPDEEQRSPEQTAQCALLRCIFGNPFLPIPSIDPGWLTRNDGAVRRIAQVIYDERELPSGALDNVRLAILADALEEAGCDNNEILQHCRERGRVHVRGCWALDLCLSKE